MDLIWLHRPDEWDPDPRAQRALRRLVGHSLLHADGVFAISRAAAEDFVRTFGLERERVSVTPLGVRPPALAPVPEHALRERLGLEDARVLLSVAQLRPYKNLGRLISALPALDSEIVLVLVGASTPHEAELRALAAELGVTDRMRILGWVSEAELAGLYALSAAFVLPSLIEGFGLPVLEAMAHGVPVACSDIPALTEVAGDAALLFDPGDQTALDRELRRLLADPGLREDLAMLGHERVAQFRWARTGEASLRGYREAMARRADGREPKARAKAR
jgi:glycosyltransferase involved in cell wall biosynthesis